MARKCYISFKAEDIAYKNHILNNLDVDMIDKSLDYTIDSHDEDYIMCKIRSDYLSDSTVTIHLIGSYGAENRGKYEQRYIKRELQASLYDGRENTRNGILGIVLPSMDQSVYGTTGKCSGCGADVSFVYIDDSTTIKEFSVNYYISGKCHWGEDDRYCVLVKWDDFVKSPETYIEQAYQKRFEPVAKKVTVYP